jgi:hypothetical protein
LIWITKLNELKKTFNLIQQDKIEDFNTFDYEDENINSKQKKRLYFILYPDYKIRIFWDVLQTMFLLM